MAFEAALPASESRVLAAILDLLRRDALRSTVEEPSQPLRDDAVATWLARPTWAAQWLSPHLGRLLEGRGLRYDPGSLGGAIEGLVGRGLLSRSMAELTPSPDVAALVTPMVLLDRITELRAGRGVDDGSVAVARVVVARAQSSALLLWELDAGGSVLWLTPTGAQASELAARLLTNGDALAPSAGHTAAPARS